jgi:hypothetical protein
MLAKLKYVHYILALLSSADGAFKAYLTGSILKYLNIRQLLGVSPSLTLLKGFPQASIPSPIPNRSIKYLATFPLSNNYVVVSTLLSNGVAIYKE